MAYAWLVYELWNYKLLGVAVDETQAKVLADEWNDKIPIFWEDYGDWIYGKEKEEQEDWDFKLRKVRLNEEIDPR